MTQSLEDLLKECTVQVIAQEKGTGFLVAPGLILTCHHVIGNRSKAKIIWEGEESLSSEAEVQHSLPIYDIALLKLASPLDRNPPCVHLGSVVRHDNKLSFFGYPDGKDYPGGCPVTATCEGLTGSNPPTIKFKSGQVIPGMSGSALLNWNTGYVCGMVSKTRDKRLALGGIAMPTKIILEHLPQLKDFQSKYHDSDSRWREAQEESKIFGENESQERLWGGSDLTPERESHKKNREGKILFISTSTEEEETVDRRKLFRTIRDEVEKIESKTDLKIENRPEIEVANLSEYASESKLSIIDIDTSKRDLDAWINGNIAEEQQKKSVGLITKTFNLYNQSIECMILNGQHSNKQADDIALSADFLINVNYDIKHEESLAFFKSFYISIFHGDSVRKAYELGIHNLRVLGANENPLPILSSKQEIKKRKDLEEKQLKIKDLEHELININKKIKKERGKAIHWKAKGQILTELGRSDEAAQAYEKASSIEPKNPKIRIAQADAFEEAGKLQKAVSAYEKSIEIRESDYRVWWKKARTLFKDGKYEAAAYSFEKATNLNPPCSDNYIIHQEHAFVLEKMRHYRNSAKLLNCSLTIELKYRTASYKKRQIYRKMYSNKS